MAVSRCQFSKFVSVTCNSNLVLWPRYKKAQSRAFNSDW